MIFISRFLWAMPVLRPVLMSLLVVERPATRCAGDPRRMRLHWVVGRGRAGLRVRGRLVGLSQRPWGLASAHQGLDTHSDRDSRVPCSNLCCYSSHMPVRPSLPRLDPSDLVPTCLQTASLPMDTPN